MKLRPSCAGPGVNVWDLDTHPAHLLNSAEPCGHCYQAVKTCETCPVKSKCWADADRYEDEWHIRAGGLFGAQGNCLKCELPLVPIDGREDLYCSTRCRPPKPCRNGHVGEMVKRPDEGWRCKACDRERRRLKTLSTGARVKA